ncbi:hypothetical protein [Collimonas antrihumi]|nr:hypothetical protein [Collimonas antrihumi]
MKIRLWHFLTIALLAIGLCACEKPVDTAPTPKVDPAGMNVVR